MKKFFSLKKYILTISMVIIVLISLIGSKYYIKEKKIKVLLNEIVEIEENFKKSESKDTRINIYKAFESSKSKYEKSILKEYNETLSLFNDWFKEDYIHSTDENTLKELEKVKIKNQINKSKEKLQAILDSIDSDGVLDENESKEIKKSINDLISSYNARVKSIEEAEKKAEAERLAREEDERKAKEKAEQEARERAEEEAEIAATQQAQEEQSYYNDYSQSNSDEDNLDIHTAKPSGGGTKFKEFPPYYNPPRNTVDISTLEPGWFIDIETGEKIEGSDIGIDVNTGNVYDANGNYLYNYLEE